MSTSKREFWRSRWWIPGFSLVLGLLILAAFWLGDDLSGGLFGLGVMAVIGALFLFGGRSETLRGLGGPGRDERWARIDVHATALAGMVTTGHHRGLARGGRPGQRRQPLRAARGGERRRVYRQRRRPALALLARLGRVAPAGLVAHEPQLEPHVLEGGAGLVGEPPQLGELGGDGRDLESGGAPRAADEVDEHLEVLDDRRLLARAHS